MPLTQDQKSELIQKFGANEKDTGSTKVQVALLTTRISASSPSTSRCTSTTTIPGAACSSWSAGGGGC